MGEEMVGVRLCWVNGGEKRGWFGSIGVSQWCRCVFYGAVNIPVSGGIGSKSRHGQRAEFGRVLLIRRRLCHQTFCSLLFA